MRFYVLFGSIVRGPLTLDIIRSLPEISPETPVCPENRDYKVQGNWKAAASYPQLLANPGAGAPERDGGASRFWRSAVARERVARALAAAKSQGAGQGRGWIWLSAVAIPLLAIALLDLQRAEVPQAPSRSSASSSSLGQAAPLFLPAGFSRDEAQRLRSMASIMVVGVQQEIVLPADGRSLKSEARFSYDPKHRELRPINETARRLLDIRRGFPKI
jgi:hypothetical protein